MKAIVVEEFGGPEVLQLREVPDPAPRQGEVVIRVRAAGVNPVDTYLRSGKYARLPVLPYTPGSDAAGEVVAVGEGVTRWREGDRVYTDHTASRAYAELMVCGEDQIHPLPISVPFAAGAALGVAAATAHRALFHRGMAREGERVLIHGATGGVGLAAVQLARASGLEVIATGGSPEGMREAERQGATSVVNHRSPDHFERLREVAGTHGFDLIIELAAHENLGADLDLLAPRGRVVVVGNRGSVSIDPRALMSRDADVRGMTLFNTSAPDRAAIHAALATALEHGTLHPVVAEEIPLADVAVAHDRILSTTHSGKIVLIPD